MKGLLALQVLGPIPEKCELLQSVQYILGSHFQDERRPLDLQLWVLWVRRKLPLLMKVRSINKKIDYMLSGCGLAS